MRISEIVRIDSRGRITLPVSIREVTGLSEGQFVMIIADLESQEVRIIPYTDSEARLVELHFILSDNPGALAQVAAFLANNQVDLLSTTSRTLKRGQSAEWIVVADLSKCKCSISELKTKIIKDRAAIKINIHEHTIR